MYENEFAPAQDLLDELTAILPLTKGGPVESAFVHPGDMTPEYGCARAWVRIVEIMPTTNFPNQLTGPAKCGTFLHAITLEVGVDRCYDRPNNNLDLTPTEINDQTKILIDDARAMRQVVGCTWPRGVSHMPLAWSSYVNGDVMRGSMRVIVSAKLGCGCSLGFTSIDDLLT